MNILIKNADILTVSGCGRNFKPFLGEVQIKDSYIAGIKRYESNPLHELCYGNEFTYDENFLPEEVIDAKGNLLMPGFVNSHTHIPMSLFRSYADDLAFFPWLTEKIFPAEARLRGNDVYIGSLLSIAEMIRFGVTSFEDMYFFMDDIVKAVDETGIRASLSRGVTTIGATREEALAKVDRAFDVREKYDGYANGRIKVDIAPHAPYTNPDEYISLMAKRAKDVGATIHIHLSESEKEVADSLEAHGKTPTAHMKDLGLFENKVIAAHCVHMSDDDIKILAKHKASVLHNPVSNLKLGNGIARISDMLAAGINVSLGTDGSSSNNNQDLLEEAKYAALLAKGSTGETTAVPATTALEMATINGAKSLGLEDKIGSIEVGKKADLIILDTASPHWMPKFDTVSNLIYSGRSSDVLTTIVDGKILMKDRVFKTLDLEKITNEAEISAEYLTIREQ